MSNELNNAFETVKAQLQVYEDDCIVLHDEPGRYYLGSPRKRKDGYAMWFGGVEIRKGHVAVHVMPIYTHPDMVETLPEGLKKRLNGKSCFHIKGLTPELTQGLSDVITAGAKRFKADGFM